MVTAPQKGRAVVSATVCAVGSHSGERPGTARDRKRGRRADRGPGTVLADAGGQVFIGRLELVPPRVGVAALTPGEVGGEIFDMDLDPRPVGGEQVQAMGQQQPPRGLAGFHAPGAFRSAGEKAKAVLTAGAQVALDLAEPAG